MTQEEKHWGIVRRRGPHWLLEVVSSGSGSLDFSLFTVFKMGSLGMACAPELVHG